MSTLTSFEIRGSEELKRLLEKAIRRNYPNDIRQAIKPGAVIVRKAIRDEAPVGPTGRLRRSAVIRSSRTRPIVMVAIDRKKALAKSQAYPTGFPYVNSVISEKRRGSKADLFVSRAVERTDEQALDAMESGMLKIVDGLF